VEKLFTSSGGVEIAGHLARPRIAPGTFVPALVISHGFPHLRQGGRLSARSFPELAERIATEMGWMVLVYTFRGCGESGGDFSLLGWRDDLLAAARFLRETDGVKGVWCAGFGTGGALSLCAAAIDTRIRGVATIGAPADFDDWANHPRRLLQHARETGIIRSASYPPAFDPWAREIREVRAVASVESLRDRPLLVMHGSDDEVVPVFDARVLADLRIIEGGGHQLRHDPRAIAVLLGWLDRQRTLSAPERTT
jgi:pimeloyl-ACP methyl ester carboxylesterase